MKMAERVARAILQRRFYDCEPEMYPGGLEEFFDTMDEDNWAEARFEAYAALREAREPSEAMRRAGQSAYWETLNDDSGDEANRIFKSMIDAALSET